MKTKQKNRGRIINQSPLGSELQYLTQSFGNLDVVSDYLGVNKSLVTKWLEGAAIPDPKTEIRIVELRYVVARLSKYFEQEVAVAWLKGNNPLLGHARPIDVLKRGGIIDVLSAISQTEAGSYL